MRQTCGYKKPAGFYSHRKEKRKYQHGAVVKDQDSCAVPLSFPDAEIFIGKDEVRYHEGYGSDTGHQSVDITVLTNYDISSHTAAEPYYERIDAAWQRFAAVVEIMAGESIYRVQEQACRKYDPERADMPAGHPAELIYEENMGDCESSYA